uniref:SHR-BD domain-containing protein n=1 Tax=Schistosoma curassoni TaxID=6186 RepID=A0A183KXW0_9TREM
LVLDYYYFLIFISTDLDPPSKTKARSFIEVTLDQAVIIWPGSLHQDKRKQPFQLERRNGLWKSVFNPANKTNKALSSSYYLQAVPFPQAIWTINNAPIPSTLNIFVSQLEQAIVLLNIDKEMDSKVIRARLINGYGRANSEVFSQTHIIQVKDPPENMATNSLDLILPPKDVSLTLKDDQPGTAVFECVFNARYYLQATHVVSNLFKKNLFRSIHQISLLKDFLLVGEAQNIYHQRDK